MLTQGVGTLLNFGLDRAFPNLYSIIITPPDDTGAGVSLRDRMLDFTYYAEKVTFGGPAVIETEYSEATKQFFIKNAQRVKTATITFRETSQYRVLSVFKDWMGNIYDFQNNIFLGGWKPWGQITVSMDPIRDGQSGGALVMANAYPTTLTYPTYDWADGNPIKIDCVFSFSDLHPNAAAHTVGSLPNAAAHTVGSLPN
jgi:hypothetical protein